MIRIITIAFASGPPGHEDEHVLIENRGPSSVSLSGWTLADSTETAFGFPQSFSLAPSAQVRVWTGRGEDTPEDLYWGQPRPVWEADPGTTATVADANGSHIAVYRYPSPSMTNASTGLGGGGALFVPVISPHSASTLFVSCDMGGLYRSTDSGEQWKMLDTRLVHGTRRFTVAFDPARPGHVVASHPVRGLQESFDEGDGWSDYVPALPAGLTVTAVGFPSDDPEHLLVGTTSGAYGLDPASMSWIPIASLTDDVVVFCFPLGVDAWFVATINDIFESTDAGLTWTSIGGTLPPRPEGPYEPELRPDEPNYVASKIRGFAGGAKDGRYVLYAAIATQESDVEERNGRKYLISGGVYVYDSEVGAWVRATPDVDVTEWDECGGTPIPRYERMAVADAVPDQAYVSVINTTCDPLVEHGSNNQGTWTWEAAFNWTSPPINVQFGWFEDLNFGLGGAANGLAVAPTDVQTLAFANLAALYLTSNGGALVPDAWARRFTAPAGSAWETTGLDVTTTWHYYELPPRVHLLCCADIGLCRSEDDGATWNHVPTITDDIRWNNFYEICERGPKMWAAVSRQHDIPHETQLSVTDLDVGAVLLSETQGATWSQVGELLDVPVVSVVSYKGTLYASRWGSGVFRSDDDGDTWVSVGTFPPDSSTLCGRIAVDHSGTLYCVVSADLRGGGFVDGGLYRLVDDQWLPVVSSDSSKLTLAAAMAPARPCPVDFCFSGPGTSGTLYLCAQSVQRSSGGGGLYQFTDKSGWEQATEIHFPEKYGDTIQAFAPFTAGEGPHSRLYVTSSHGVWYTDERDKPPSQQTWQELRLSPYLYAHRLGGGRPGEAGHHLRYLTTFGGGAWSIEVPPHSADSPA